VKAVLILALSALSAFASPDQHVLFTNQTATFRTLEGKVFYHVTLVRADLDGIVWRTGASGGRICYTNLDPGLLESWSISSNRIDIARARAEHKAAVDARYRAIAAAEAAATLKRYREEHARVAAQASTREREAQRQADLARLVVLRKQVEVARDSLRHMETAARDANQARINNPSAPFFYVKESTRIDLRNDEKRLQQLEAGYVAKYGTGP